MENSADVDVQMANLKGKSGSGNGGGADMDGMQVEGGDNDSMALTRPGSLDVAAHANMAVALAPRIGECYQ